MPGATGFRLTALLAIGLLTGLAFWPALHGPWLLDDIRLQDMLSTIGGRGVDALSALWGRDALWIQDGGGTGRPLAMSTLVANVLIDTSPFGFKLVNLGLHVVTAWLVFLLARELLRLHYDQRATDRWALLVALVWAVHPLQVSTVAYVVQRMTLLSALFAFAALLLYVRWRRRTIQGDADGSPVAWISSLFVLPGLAVLAKENGVLVPLLLLLVEIIFFRLRDRSGALHRPLTVYFSAILVIGMVVLWWLIWGSDYLRDGYLERPFDLQQHLLSELRVLSMYVFQIMLPRIGSMAFFYDGMTPSVGWFSPPTTLVSLLFVMALVALAIVFVRRRPLLSFGILFFFLGQSMESTLLPLELVFEHRNYLPSFGLVIAATDLLAGATALVAAQRRFLAVVMVAALAALTWIRAEAWRTQTGILATAIAANPDSQRARASLAEVFAAAGREADARRLLESSGSLAANLQLSYLDCRQAGQVATDRLRHAHGTVGQFLSDTETGLLIELVNLELGQRCVMDAKALLSLIETAAQAPRMSQIGRQKLWMYVAHLRHGAGDGEGARAALERAFTIDRRNPVPLALAADWAIEADAGQTACDLLRRAWTAAESGAVDIESELLALEQRLSRAGQACRSGRTLLEQARR